MIAKNYNEQHLYMLLSVNCVKKTTKIFTEVQMLLKLDFHTQILPITWMNADSCVFISKDSVQQSRTVTSGVTKLRFFGFSVLFKQT